MCKLLSIVVPTKNRYYYLKHLILLVNGFCSEDIELVIQDNTEDNSEIILFLQDNVLTNVKYFHTKSQLSITENSDLAILNSSGRYVCFIGDDDGVSREIIDYVRWMDQNNIDSLRSKVAIYKWPGVKGYAFNFSSSFLFSKNTNKIKYITDFDIVRKNVLRNGATDQLFLPRIYCGIVKREILDKVYSITKSYFPGPSPDMASAMALSFCVKKHVVIDVSLIIAGHSPKSAGGLGASHKHTAEIDDVPWLSHYTKNEWEKTIPKYWTPHTIYAESAIKSLRRMGKEEYIKHMNFSYLYASILMYNSELFFKVSKFLTFRNIIAINYYFLQILFARGSVFIKNFLLKKNFINNITIKYNIISINECEKYLFDNK